MHAVIRTGGKQYRVQPGDELNVELLEVDKGGEVSFDVLAVGDGDDLEVGQPLVAGATVKGRVVTHDRARKVIVFKKKRRKGYQVKRGHRQPFTRVQITEVTGGNGGGQRRVAASTKVVQASAPVEVPAVTQAPAPTEEGDQG